MGKKNGNSVLFIYEGDTEKEFYDLLLSTFFPDRKIRISQTNLKGTFSLDDKVDGRIQTYLNNDNFKDCNQITVIVAYDREGDRTKLSALNLDCLEKKFVKGKRARVSRIIELIATQDLESWFFHDMEGIYRYLRVPAKQRRIKKHSNVESTNNRVLSKLFHQHGKHYQKGRKAEGFIQSLSLDIIVARVPELQYVIDLIKSLH